MPDDLGPDYESGEDARDHFAQGHFAGCGNCGFPVDVSILVLQHSDLLLSMVMELLESTEPADLAKAIALTRGSMDETMRAKAMDAHEHLELGTLHRDSLDRRRTRDETTQSEGAGGEGDDSS